jgi:pimeloyl-ACP methyl ester carboxylesterase
MLMTVEPKPLAVRGGAFNPSVYRAGSGEPLLWFHAAGGMNRGWSPELEALAKHYDVIAPVHPGWDDSPGLDEIDDIHDMVVYYQDVVDALGLKSFNLAGHSVGGLFAAEFAAARPDLVKKLVLIAPVGMWIDERRSRCCGRWRARARRRRPRTRTTSPSTATSWRSSTATASAG